MVSVHTTSVAADAPSVVEHGRVAVGPVHVLDRAVAKDRNERVLVPAGPAAPHHVVDLGADDRPDLRPALATGLAHRGRMLADAEARHVGVVVDLDQVRSPPQEHRVTGAQHHRHRRLQRSRPAGHRPQGGSGPVDAADQRARLTPSSKDPVEIMRSHVVVTSALRALERLQHSGARRPERLCFHPGRGASSTKDPSSLGCAPGTVGHDRGSEEGMQPVRA